MNKLSITDIKLQGKRVLLRVDFNVPQDDKLNITDDTRIRASLPTIQYIIEHGGKAILISHLGRPKGKINEKYSLAPVAKRLSKLIGKKVVFANNCIGPQVKSVIQSLNNGDIALLENVRFYPEEENNNPDFAQKLAQLGNVYCNDAFGTAHRAHASTEGITKFIRPAVAGLLMEKELNFLGKTLSRPERPFIAILGGAKISSKIGVIKNLLPQVDALLIGGGMAYTFFKARGWNIGNSLLDEKTVPIAAEILKLAQEKNYKLILPIDIKIADKFEPNAQIQNVNSNEIPDGWQGVDIGSKTIELFKKEIEKAKTILWNGPVGVFEIAPFAIGTNQIALTLANTNATTVIGGGDSIAALEKIKCIDKITHVSTGGGASLEFLEGISLPGVAALTDRKSDF